MMAPNWWRRCWRGSTGSWPDNRPGRPHRRIAGAGEGVERPDRRAGSQARWTAEDAGQFLAAAFARAEGERRAADGQAAAQGPARYRAQAGRESMRDATLLRRALCLRRRAERRRTGTREGVRSY